MVLATLRKLRLNHFNRIRVFFNRIRQFRAQLFCELNPRAVMSFRPIVRNRHQIRCLLLGSARMRNCQSVSICFKLGNPGVSAFKLMLESDNLSFKRCNFARILAGLDKINCLVSFRLDRKSVV